MQPISNSNLAGNLLSELQQIQNQVNSITSFNAQSEEAHNKWSNKNSLLFTAIKAQLKQMCVSVEVCNYCEKNEASDIEHIYPISRYPEKAFIWDNYLLACAICNRVKLDTWYEIRNNQLFKLPRGSKPDNNHPPAFINPRIENPNEYMILELSTFTFTSFCAVDSAGFLKYCGTCKVLQLNDRTALVASRKARAREMYTAMHRLSNVIKSTDKSEIRNAINPYEDYIDIDALTIQEIKDKITLNTKKLITESEHPSVWYAIKKSHQVYDQWKTIFQVIPDALNW